MASRFAMAIPLCLLPSTIVAQDATALAGTILCLSPFRLEEARTAFIASDKKWLQSLNCLTVTRETAVTVIEYNSLGWKVRVPTEGGGVTAWSLDIAPQPGSPYYRPGQFYRDMMRKEESKN